MRSDCFATSFLSCRYTFITEVSEQNPNDDENSNDLLSDHLSDDVVHKTMTSLEVPMMTCDDGVETLPYTLVCDFRKDCSDGSDEQCVYPQCHADQFMCKSGQVISVQI